MNRNKKWLIAIMLLTVAAISRWTLPASSLAAVQQPRVEARKTQLLSIGKLKFRDLNKNGSLDKYEDWRLSVEVRVADLLAQMTDEEKTGLMVHASLMGFTGPGGAVLDAPAAPRPGSPGGFRPPRRAGVEPMSPASPTDLVVRRNVRWILVRPAPGQPPDVTARFHNNMQEIAEGSRLGIPIAFSSDPRHSGQQSAAGVAGTAGPTISQWPEQIGFAAIGSANAVREFGHIAAEEYRAMGLAVALSPMADVVTEPRWNRISGTFGEDAQLAAQLVKAYVEGFQGRQLSPTSVLTVTKHFPGDGPVKDGLDPHNDYGQWQVYPGNNLEYHLRPFKAAFEAGTGAIMPAYAIPVGKDTVGMAFSKIIITDMLRGQYGFDGVVITDWLRNMPWGVEGLTEKQRQQRIVDAGCDQIGGDNDPKYLTELVREGAISKARLNQSARRLLKPLFQLGLFENPYVDAERAKTIVASEDFVRAGQHAQTKSVVLLKNERDFLPLKKGPRLYVEGLRREIAARYGAVVDDPKGADAAVIRVNAPYAVHQGGGSFFPGAKEGTLAFSGAENARELDAIKRLVASGTPTVVCMYMDRPAVLSEFIGDARAVFAHFNVNDEALLDLITGRVSPTGKLPFDLPRDMESVTRQKEDVPHDLGNPLFRFGFGLSYKKSMRY